jgi:hypothetical protein
MDSYPGVFELVNPELERIKGVLNLWCFFTPLNLAEHC